MSNARKDIITLRHNWDAPVMGKREDRRSVRGYEMSSRTKRVREIARRYAMF